MDFEKYKFTAPEYAFELNCFDFH